MKRFSVIAALMLAAFVGSIAAPVFAQTTPPPAAAEEKKPMKKPARKAPAKKAPAKKAVKKAEAPAAAPEKK
jgi:hypothetical protein